MSDAAKWAILAASIVVILGLILALPFMQGIDFSALTSAVNTVVSVVGTGFITARGMVNMFLSPFGRTLLTGIIGYLFLKPIILLAPKLIAWADHYIFK